MSTEVFGKRGASSARGRIATQERIDMQIALVAGLEPGSAEHRLATRVLLLLQDGMFLLSETDVLLRRTERQPATEG